MKLNFKATLQILNSSVPSGTLQIKKFKSTDTKNFIEVLKNIPYEKKRTEWNNIIGDLADVCNNPLILEQKNWHCEDCKKITSSDSAEECQDCNSTNITDKDPSIRTRNETIDRAKSKWLGLSNQVHQILRAGNVFLSFINNELVGAYHTEYGKGVPAVLNRSRKENGLEPIPKEGFITKYGVHKTIEDFVGGVGNYDSLKSEDLEKLILI